MQTHERSLIRKLDIGLSNSLYLLFAWLINALIWLLGLLMLSGQLARIFEYGEGLADVSWHEWAFMLLFGLLLWRHIRYCQHVATGFWRGLSRLLTVQGRLGCVLLTVLGFAIAVEQVQGGSADLVSTAVDPVFELVGLGLALMAVYLAAPLVPTARSQQPSVSRVEPTFTRTEKDVIA